MSEGYGYGLPERTNCSRCGKLRSYTWVGSNGCGTICHPCNEKHDAISDLIWPFLEAVHALNPLSEIRIQVTDELGPLASCLSPARLTSLASPE